jgi:DNA-binding transcriptional LysR family regulator
MMARRNLNDLLAFVTVARQGSFTRAAATLGVTQSALSQAIRGLEERLRIRLLTRTTRSVAPTAAGERLAHAIGHRFDEIEAELDALTELRDKPAGTVRITCSDNVLRAVLLLHAVAARDRTSRSSSTWRRIPRRNGDRFDAGVPPTASTKCSWCYPPPLRMAVVASPTTSRSILPKTPQDLTAHRCINQRMPSSGGLYVWTRAPRQASERGSILRRSSTPAAGRRGADQPALSAARGHLAPSVDGKV